MHNISTAQVAYKPTRIEYVPGMNRYSKLLEGVSEKELIVTLVRICNFL